MLSSFPSQSMYPASEIHFRNPFPSHGEHIRPSSRHRYDINIQSPSSGYAKVNHALQVNRPLTPPPDMNTVAPHVQASQYSTYYPERSTVKYEAPAIKYEPSSTIGRTQEQLHKPCQTRQEISKRSPVFIPSTSNAPQRDSQIALSLQIPRSINDSQGSLAELAAQITCLFWFESSTILERAENAATYSTPQKALIPDAIPTTGFRKWVTTILSTTQVAQNVIILALLFIHRLKKLNPSVKGKPGSEYRLLTVALMLGNKFLDDNTYTNKTWAEVSGISVGEVHIMEVEFLSNMKYALFTSAEEWQAWQTKLGRFALYFDKASRIISMPVLPPAPTPLAPHMHSSLPSPPVSNHASPPYHADRTPVHPGLPQPHGVAVPSHGPSPNPSSLGPIPNLSSQQSRKRSLDSTTVEPPQKRLATSSALGHQYAPSSSTTSESQAPFRPAVTLPSLQIPQSGQYPSSTQSTPGQQTQYTTQLPPMNYQHRAHMTSAQQTVASTWAQTSSIPAPVSHYNTPLQASHLPPSVSQSRHQSPFAGSANVSPTNGALQPAGQAHSLQSPTYWLQQRNSPYRPIRGVNTLLVPPPSRVQQPHNVGREQMHYQPLGRPQERQQGQLPYIAQNQWYDRWPGLDHHQSSLHQVHLPNPFFARG